MSFVFSRAQVQKATRRRQPWKTTRTRQRLDALSKSMGQAIGADLQKGLTGFKKRVNPEHVYQAYLHRDFSKIIQTIPWKQMDTSMDPAYTSLGSALEASWDLGVESVGSLLARIQKPPMQDLLRWDTSNPRIRNFIGTRRAHVYRNLTQDSARNIQAWTLRSMNQALTPRQVADGIKDQIGLLPAHAVAVDKYRAGLIADGAPRAFVDAQTSRYAGELLDYRAMMIGRTETRLATNKGQLTVWRQAADQGLIDRRTAQRRWICDGEDPCEDCLPMEGQTVPLDSPFIMADGTAVDCPPEDVHPHCDCTEDIVYGDEEE